jgi:biopolymer transport protein TolR
VKRRSPPQPEMITKVNVTPIIDVALVLVIILIVTAPMLSAADLPVELPEARTREAENQANISVTLARDGALAVDDRLVTPLELGPAIAARLADEGADVLVVVRADAEAPYARVRAVLDEARGAGARRLAIATRQKMEATP